MGFFLIIVVLLFILATSDLMVGVSNDAVNFLNSALGSKVASRNTIMIIVSLGILVGVMFSSGMMEVARKGIFNPQYYYFSEVMVIFIAVMMTDIFLLDLFNTFGMPTSTTVSIVFELLGAAVAVGILKIMNSDQDFDQLSLYINSSSALTIITSILLSVGIAFIVGTVVQYLSRLLFSFHYEKKIKNIGVLWSGLAFSLLTYFLIFKGLKGASFITKDTVKWLGDNLILLLGIAFVVWTLFLGILHYIWKINVLRLVVLFGTFSLAMAFAGNDLVNFIGVPLAGLNAYQTWVQSGVAADSLSMESLTNPVKAETYILLLAGIIMIVTLWFSKKAQSVTETEINLGRQDEGAERFAPNALSRGIVRVSLLLAKGVNTIIPNSINTKIDKQFEPVQYTLAEEKTKPAFDLVRGSVNLTVASMLIAFATSLKLPLSTTYVSFMVAMGTSLADRAWGRDSAVYRIAGVLGVIGGWFATALIAFTVAGFVAFLIYEFEGIALVILVALLLFFVIRTYIYHRKKEAKQESLKAYEKSGENAGEQLVAIESAQQVTKTLSQVSKIYSNSIYGVIKEDVSYIRKAKRDRMLLEEYSEEFRRYLYSSIKNLDTSNDLSRLYLLIFDINQDIIQSASLILESCETQVANYLKPVSESQAEGLQELKKRVIDYIEHAIKIIDQENLSDLSNILNQKSELLISLEREIYQQIEGIKKSGYSLRNSMLIFSLELETKDLVARIGTFLQMISNDEINLNKIDIL